MNIRAFSFLLLFGAHALEVASQSSAVAFQLLSETPAVFPATPQTVVADALGRPYFYLAAKAAGLQVFDIQNPAQPKWVKSVSMALLEGLEVSNACQRGAYLYLALGNFFNPSGQKPGLAIVDVSNPLSPVVKDVWIASTPDEGGAFVAVSGDYAYLGAMKQGLFILNIANPGDIKWVSQTIPDPDFPVPNPSSIQQPNARGLAVNGDLVFLCYDAGGLRVLNVADKAHPIEISHYLNPAFSGKQQAFNNLVLDGNTAYVAVDYCGMEVLDVSNPASIQQKAWWNPWQCESPSNAWNGSPGHTNQIALDLASHLVFLSSAQSELSVVDVSDPSKPLLAGTYGNTSNQLGTWGMTLDGKRVFLTYIITFVPFVSNWAGVKVLSWNAVSGSAEAGDLQHGSLSPNPFVEKLRFQFDLQSPTYLQAELFSAPGAKVADLPLGHFEAGQHQWEWTLDEALPAGIYWLRVSTANHFFTEKIVKQ